MSVEPLEPRTPLPTGYRQAVVSAITLILGFSLLFLRYWSFELPGEWGTVSTAAALLVILAVVLQIYVLWRSLQVEDDDEATYQTTLRWFLASIILLFLGLLLAGINHSGWLT